MAHQTAGSGKSDKPWIIHVPEIDEDLLRAAAIEPDGGDQFAATVLGEFDAKNARAVGQAQAQRQAAEARLPYLKRDAERAAKHVEQTRSTRTVVTREKLADLTWFQIIEAFVSLIGAIVALVVSNGVLANYVVNSGNALYATDPIGARLFAGLVILAALGIRTFEHWLPSDTARARYASVIFAVGVSTLLLWALATATTFAPNDNGAAWLTAGTNGGWTGIVLVFAHVIGDVAWGYLLIAGAEKVLLGNRKRIEIKNPHYAVAKAQAERAAAAEKACGDEIAEADAFIAAVGHARTELQGQLELELDRRTALWRAQQEAGAALARAQFLNAKG